jgi:hypothetical protein
MANTAPETEAQNGSSSGSAIAQIFEDLFKHPTVSGYLFATATLVTIVGAYSVANKALDGSMVIIELLIVAVGGSAAFVRFKGYATWDSLDSDGIAHTSDEPIQKDASPLARMLSRKTTLKIVSDEDRSYTAANDEYEEYQDTDPAITHPVSHIPDRFSDWSLEKEDLSPNYEAELESAIQNAADLADMAMEPTKIRSAAKSTEKPTSRPIVHDDDFMDMESALQNAAELAEIALDPTRAHPIAKTAGKASSRAPTHVEEQDTIDALDLEEAIQNAADLADMATAPTNTRPVAKTAGKSTSRASTRDTGGSEPKTATKTKTATKATSRTSTETTAQAV